MGSIKEKTFIMNGSGDQNGHDTEVLDIKSEASINVRRLDINTSDYTDHENYQLLWIADGVENITVDLETIPFYQNTILFLVPGRIVSMEFSGESPTGWILGFSRDFFKNQNLEGLNIKNADIFHTYEEMPRIVLSPKIGERIHSIAEMIAEFAGSGIPNKEVAISALLRTMLVYCDSKCNLKPSFGNNRHDLHIVSLFKHHVSRNFLKYHRVSQYARLMNITPKYLNQVVKRVMGVTAKSVIQEQLIIQACRDLKFSNESIKEIAFKLGFAESEHFSHFFKKGTGKTPLEFRNT
jgi:AraC family transcriptional regulator, transcriptional activator of pobA